MSNEIEYVIPKKARDIFYIQEGDDLLLLGDEARGLALLPANAMKKFTQAIESNVFAQKEEW